MKEIDARIISTNIVERLRAKGHQPSQIQVRPNGSGVTTRVAFVNGLAVEAIVPPGFFDYDRIADDLCGQISNAVIDSDS